MNQEGQENIGGYRVQLGQKEELYLLRKTDFGVYLGESMEAPKEETVLLPKKQVPSGLEEGDKIEVFLYKDSSDRMIATTNEPALTLGEVGVLKVKEVTKIGAFLDWNLEKDLLLPFKEQIRDVKAEEEVLVRLYVDKSGRLCASMKIYDYLEVFGPYVKGDHVKGVVYDMKELGAMVAVDKKYHGLIPKREIKKTLKFGQCVTARVVRVREDGKLDLSLSEEKQIQMDIDSAMIMKRLDEYDGVLPFNDKADPKVIEKEFGISKNAFKRAVGRLLKAGKIKITEKSIQKI